MPPQSLGAPHLAEKLGLADPTAAIVPFQPSYEDRPGAPDRVFAAVDDEAYEPLVAAWSEALARAGAASADVLHFRHLTPANEAALRAFPAVPVVGQLHGTELALLRAIEPAAPAGWRFAGRWAARQRRWAQACEPLHRRHAVAASRRGARACARAARQAAGAHPRRRPPGEREGQHPLAAARALGNDQVVLAGWRPHGALPQALIAADLLVLPSVAEALGSRSSRRCPVGCR